MASMVLVIEDNQVNVKLFTMLLTKNGYDVEVAGTAEEGIERARDLDPALVNGDPYGDGWMLKLRAEDDDALEGLMSPEDYESHIDG